MGKENVTHMPSGISCSCKDMSATENHFVKQNEPGSEKWTHHVFSSVWNWNLKSRMYINLGFFESVGHFWYDGHFHNTYSFNPWAWECFHLLVSFSVFSFSVFIFISLIRFIHRYLFVYCKQDCLVDFFFRMFDMSI